MHPIQTISIPEPCHQLWQQMSTVGNGRHCNHCCKTVVDFSAMSDDEVSTQLAGTGNICGRFETKQLDKMDNKHTVTRNRRFLWRSLLGAVSLLGMVAAVPGYASTGISGVQTDTRANKRKPVQTGKTTVHVSLPKHNVHPARAVANVKRGVVNSGLSKAIPVLRHITFSKPVAVHPGIKNTLVTHAADTMSYVLGKVKITGVAIKKEEEKPDKELLYDLGIR